MDTLQKMKQISIIWGAIIFSIVLTLIVSSVIYKKNIKKYDILTDKLELAARKYIDQKSLYPEAKETIKVTVNQINAKTKQIDMQINGQDCQGFVLVSRKKAVITYKSFIKCPKYTTKNYNHY